MQGLRQGWIGVVLFSMAMPAFAVDGLSLTAGHWDKTDGHLARVAAQWDWLHWPKAKREGALDVYVDTSFAYLSSDKFRHDHIAVWAASPVIRFSILKNNTFQPFAEAGVGAAWLSRTQFADRHLSTHFQFEDRAGVGVRLYQKYEAAIHYRHYSNCGIEHPNNGIDFYTATLAYRF
jgi:lipid A 3-O-deacylase